MKRRQVLLNEDQVTEIKKIALKQGVSQSKVVRILLDRALHVSEGAVDDVSEFPKQDTYLYDRLYYLETFDADNPRIGGFKELFSVGGKTTNIAIVSHASFDYYLEKGTLPSELIAEINKISKEFSTQSVTKKIAVRRAYVVPGIENPPGPRFLGVVPTEVASAVKEVMDFAIQHDYHKKSESQVCVFFYPFADPKPLDVPVAGGVELPYGGYAIPLNKKASRVEVLAVWGNNEGVQSFDAIDRYIVDTEKQIILEKNVPQKDVMLCTTTRDQSDKVRVPPDKQFEQVLNDVEVLESARVVKELTRKYGLRRVEFSFDGRETITFNESVPYSIQEKETVDIDKVGEVYVVEDGDDIEHIRRFSPKEVEKHIIYISKVIVENRSYDLLNSVAGMSSKFTVLYPGLSATAHAMRVLNDFGHTAVTVGNRTFKTGDKVEIKVHGMQIAVNKISKEAAKNYAVNLYDAKLYGNSLVGGKAINLSKLKSRGYNVPHGYVLTTAFCGGLLESSKVDRSKVLPLVLEVLRGVGLSKEKIYAVRSSANVEDGKQFSFAGQFESFLFVSYDQVAEKVVDVVESSFSTAVEKYAKEAKGSEEIKMAVIVQEMIDAEKAGVVFGKDIQTNNPDLVVIDAGEGVAEGVVEGTSETQRIVYSKSKDEFHFSGVKKDKNILDRYEIDALVEMNQGLEQLMGELQDVEWAIDKEDNIWIIQSRSL